MRESDWPEVSRLIEEEWERDHPVLDKDFFFWQHGGFGPISGLGSTALALREGQVIGMRGVIPGVYQVPTARGRYELVPGGSFAMWIVEQSSRGTGVGSKLLAHCQAHLGVTVALGSNESTSVPIYLNAGFERQDGLHHWFALLDIRARHLLYGSQARLPLWDKLPGISAVPVKQTIDSMVASEIWTKFSERLNLFSLHRSEHFWVWRYLNHPTFEYKLHVDDALTTLAVTRIEQVVVRGGVVSVLRLIELFSTARVHDAQGRERHVAGFLKSLLVEAIEMGASAVDYRCSSVALAGGLKVAGFHFREMENVGTFSAGFAGQLEPLILGPRPINLHWKIQNKISQADSEPYFVKSDNDMDRPNYRGRRSLRLDDA
jgi:GNAT superfamily N-acetyltransferase